MTKLLASIFVLALLFNSTPPVNDYKAQVVKDIAGKPCTKNHQR